MASLKFGQDKARFLGDVWIDMGEDGPDDVHSSKSFQESWMARLLRSFEYTINLTLLAHFIMVLAICSSHLF